MLVAAAGSAACLACGSAEPAVSLPVAGLDLAALSDAEVRRVYGSIGDGTLGLPVAGGADVDGDGLGDVAFAVMQASPGGVENAGRVYLVFGDGAAQGPLDTAVEDPRILRIDGSVSHEYAGSELWLDDVTGDGIGDLLIGRQSYTAFGGTPEERVGAGALSVVVGGPALRALSERLSTLALDAAGAGADVLTLLGSMSESRLGIWMRTGDVTGDGTADIVVGADQESDAAPRAGAAYVIAGGPWLAAAGTADLAARATSPLAGYVARLTPPPEPLPLSHHFGATCQIADLDGNGRGEVLVASTLNRAGAILDASGLMLGEGTGGTERGTTFIFWDDNFPELPWPLDFGFSADLAPGERSVIHGGPGNASFGEELLGGADWDQDGLPDLFIGDLAASNSGRPGSGSSHIIYGARALRGVEARVDELPRLSPAIRTTSMVGAGAGHISGDTAADGDFTGDGHADLVVCSPHASPLGRPFAGALHVFRGVAGGWPARVDLARPDPNDAAAPLAVYGARGSFGADRGDTLCYSAAAADLDGDGQTDLITNEMVGNGLAPDSVDAGNLLVVSGVRLRL